MAKARRLLKERATQPPNEEDVSKKKRDDLPRSKLSVVIRASVMTQQQEQRLSTAVDALLSEWVREEMSRAKQS